MLFHVCVGQFIILGLPTLGEASATLFQLKVPRCKKEFQQLYSVVPLGKFDSVTICLFNLVLRTFSEDSLIVQQYMICSTKLF